MIKTINNVLTKENCFDLYKGLTSHNIWQLNISSNLKNLGGCFPEIILVDNEKVVCNHQYWIGYFNCLFDRINQKLLEQHSFSLTRNIKKIALNAQNNNHYTNSHTDGEEDTFSIVGFFTPQWAEDWGGELNIEGKIIKYNSGDFILFNSNQLHKSEPIKQIPYWRTSVNYVIKK